MRRSPAVVLAAMFIVLGATLISAKPESGELFPDVPEGKTNKSSSTKTTPNSNAKTPTPPPAPKPVPKRPPPKPVVARPPITPSTQPTSRPAFNPTHRITLQSGRVIEGMPTTVGDKLDIKTELGTVTVESFKVEKIERITN